MIATEECARNRGLVITIGSWLQQNVGDYKGKFCYYGFVLTKEGSCLQKKVRDYKGKVWDYMCKVRVCRGELCVYTGKVRENKGEVCEYKRRLVITTQGW